MEEKIVNIPLQDKENTEVSDFLQNLPHEEKDKAEEIYDVLKEKNKIIDFFISHSGDELEEAEKLYNMLKEINPGWEVFFDKYDMRFSDNWEKTMFDAIARSRNLIFLAKTPQILKEGGGWVEREVKFFYHRQTTNVKNGNPSLNVSYFGITYGWNMERDLFSDPEYGNVYRARYESPNHLFLGKDESVENFATVIGGKVQNMAKMSVNYMPAIIFDRSYKYASLREEENESFKREFIIDSIIPHLSCLGKFYSLEEIFPVIEEKNIAIIGYHGGSGKTTMMNKILFHFLDKVSLGQTPSDSLIPIYIEGSALAGQDNLIIRNIARNLYGEMTATDSFTTNETANIISALKKEFAHEAVSPNYLLLIDGYNEIPAGILEKFNRELKEFHNYKNVRIVISGRDVDAEVMQSFFDNDDSAKFSLAKISFNAVKSFLFERGLTQEISESLMKILSIPMYLTMYTNVSTEKPINTRCDLLKSFLDRQALKDAESTRDDSALAARYKFFLEQLLPFVAFRLVTKDTADLGNFVLTGDEILDIMIDAREYFFKTGEYKRYCGEKGRATMRNSGLEAMDEYDLADLSLEYYTKVSKLLRIEDAGDNKTCSDDKKIYQFVHQVYRDFFAAKHIYDDICFAANTKCACHSLIPLLKEYDVTGLAVEFLNEEKKPVLDVASGIRNYDCNKDSRLIRLIENSRTNGQCDDADFLRGVIKLLKTVRHEDLSGCDFSGLNLSKSNFCFSILSAGDCLGTYPSSFRNSTINSENLMLNNPVSSILAACINESAEVVFDASGTLSFWEKGFFNNKPLKIINDIPYKFHKLIFGADGKKIYAMDAHNIIEIPIPEEKFSRGECTVLFHSEKRLRNFFFDKSGEIYFTTVFNSFNPKPISNPDADDDIKFYGINSASAVRHDKKQVAFGYVAGYHGIKIYDFDDEKNIWVEKKIGVQLLLDELIRKIENYFKEQYVYLKPYLGKKVRVDLNRPTLYEKFFTEAEYRGVYRYRKEKDFRCSFFEGLLSEFNNEHSGYDGIPMFLCKRVRERALLLGIEDENLISFLKNLQSEYEVKIAELEKNNRALTYMHGRKFSSVEYKEDTSKLLVTYYNEYNEKGKHYIHTTVAEFDTTTLSAKIINVASGAHKIRAEYSGDDILIISKDRLTVVTPEGGCYPLPVVIKYPPQYFHADGADTFYMFTGDAVSVFDSDFVCKKNIINKFAKSVKYCMLVSEDSTPYLVVNQDYDKYSSYENYEKLLYMFNLKKGVWEKRNIFSTDTAYPACDSVIGFFGRSITNRTGKIVLYEDGFKENILPFQRFFFISGCDFCGIKGTLTDPAYMEILNFFGAQTDYTSEKIPFEKPQLDFSFNPSDVPYEEPENVKNLKSPYIYDTEAEHQFVFEEVPKIDRFTVWSKIQVGSIDRKGFSPSDLSILENLENLCALTPRMVYFLMKANQIEKPFAENFGRVSVQRRLRQTLFKTLRLIRKAESINSPEPIYTHSRFAKLLIPEIINLSHRDSLFYLKFPEAAEILILNFWYSYTLMKLGDKAVKGQVNAFVEAENFVFPVKKVVRRYIKLTNGALFPRVMRSPLTEKEIQKNVDSIKYFCALASNYPSLMIDGIKENMSAAPTIVILCEDLDSCKKFNEAIENVSPHIRKVFTYDALLLNCIHCDTPEDMYIEFRDKKPYKVGLDDLI